MIVDAICGYVTDCTRQGLHVGEYETYEGNDITMASGLFLQLPSLTAAREKFLHT